MFELDKETTKIMRIFKTIEEKESVADTLSNLTVKIGLEKGSTVLRHYYGKNEPDLVISSCICFGLINLMQEDFYVVKEVLGSETVCSILNDNKKYIEMLKPKVLF